MSDALVRYFFDHDRSEAKLLLLVASHPSDIANPTSYGLTPLKAAIQQGTPNEVRLLLANGAVADAEHFEYANRYFNKAEIVAVMHEWLMANVIRNNEGQSLPELDDPTRGRLMRKGL